MTTLQKEMLNAVGHSITVQLKNIDKTISGECIGYTQPLDNDPEVAAIQLKTLEYSSLIEITEHEIVSITVLADTPTVCGTADPHMDGYFIMERNIKEDENNV